MPSKDSDNGNGRGLLGARPCSSIDDHGHVGSGNGEELCDFGLADARFKKLPNLSDTLLCEFGEVGLFTRAKLSFVKGISHIRKLASGPKMRWVYAQFVISIRAVVKNQNAFRNYSKMERPRNSMGQPHFGNPERGKASWRAYNAIPRSVGSRRPQPATISFTHLLPKSLQEYVRKSLRGEKVCASVWPFNQVHFGWIAPREVASFAVAFVFLGNNVMRRQA